MQTANVMTVERHRMGTDGPGIRTLVGFAGCPLRCRYCLNSFTWDGSAAGRHYSVRELLETVSVDSVYFQATGGGITFGGGEPLLHAHFIAEFIKAAPKEWNFTVETALAVPFSAVQAVATDRVTFLVDIKTLDPHIYAAYTGGNVMLMRDNLSGLITLVGRERVIARVPTIPHFADETSAEGSAAELIRMGLERIERFSYIEKQVPQKTAELRHES